MKGIFFLVQFFFLANYLEAQISKIIPVKSNDIIFVPSEDRIYFTTPSGGSNGNSLCILNPYFGTVEECFFVGSEPNKLALSDDNNFLYIGFDGAPEVAKFSIPLNEVVLRFSLLEEDFMVPLYVEDIEVLPGFPNSIVVARKKLSIGRHAGLAIYDDGIKRPEISQSSRASNSITFIESNGKLFGYENESSGHHLIENIIDSNGVYQGSFYREIIRGNVTIKSQDNFIYSSNGFKIDVSGNIPGILGRYNIPFHNSYAIEPARDSNVVFTLTAGEHYNIMELSTFDKQTFNKLDSTNFPFMKAENSNLIHWGSAKKLAFNSDNAIILIHKCNSLVTDTLVLHPTIAGGCFGDTVTITAPDGYDNYYWSNGSTSQSITVSTEGEFSFSVADSSGCLSMPSNTVEVGFNTQPGSPWISSNPNVYICEGGSLSLSATILPSPNHSYLWSTGETSPSIDVIESGSYSVSIISQFGCVGYSSNVIQVDFLSDTIPDQPVITNGGNDYFCQGQFAVLSAPPGYNIYLWSNNQTTQEIGVSQGGAYSVRVGNHPGCMSLPSQSKLIYVIPSPSKPTIFKNGNVLASSSQIGNQWFKNGIILSGDTLQFLEVTESGFYTVQVTINECISPMSDISSIIIVGSKDNELDANIRVFPNPSSDIIYIRLGNDESHLFSKIEIIDLTGKTMLSESQINKISIYHLPKGMYILRIKDSNFNYIISKKIVLQ